MFCSLQSCRMSLPLHVDLLPSLGQLGSPLHSLRVGTSFLTCSSCFDSNLGGLPKVLPCSHTVCAKCLVESGPFQCPQCSKLDLAGCLNLASLRLNDVLPLCSSCDDRNHAKGRCRDCNNELLCENCINAHQRVRLTRDHTILRFAPSPSLVSITAIGSPAYPIMSAEIITKQIILAYLSY